MKPNTLVTARKKIQPNKVETFAQRNTVSPGLWRRLWAPGSGLADWSLSLAKAEAGVICLILRTLQRQVPTQQFLCLQVFTEALHESPSL